jgi:hypothetical protein
MRANVASTIGWAQYAANSSIRLDRKYCSANVGAILSEAESGGMSKGPQRSW